MKGNICIPTLLDRLNYSPKTKNSEQRRLSYELNIFSLFSYKCSCELCCRATCTTGVSDFVNFVQLSFVIYSEKKNENDPRGWGDHSVHKALVIQV